MVEAGVLMRPCSLDQRAICSPQDGNIHRAYKRWRRLWSREDRTAVIPTCALRLVEAGRDQPASNTSDRKETFVAPQRVFAMRWTYRACMPEWTEPP